MTLRLASPFQDRAVLQRDQTLPVWGWAAPETLVRVTLAGHEARVLGNAHGDWLVRLPALPAGGPHTLTVESPATRETLSITDLLVGEVWVASGQSNMHWTLDQSRPLTDDVIAAADFPSIRFFNVGRRTRLGSHRTVGGVWQPASPESAPDFSAVAFAFARRLQRELDVPVGILSSALGGTLIQAWTSRPTLAHNPDIAEWFAGYEALAYVDRRLPADPGVTRPWHAADLDDSAWAAIDLPATWQSAGEEYSGVFWFRRTVELPSDWIGRDLELHLGAADKQDIAFVNGREVGRTGEDLEDRFWNVPRIYAVPAALVTSRRLVIAVRVYSFFNDGGLIGPAAGMRLSPTRSGERQQADSDLSLPLAGPWRFRCEHDFGLVVRPQAVPGQEEPNAPHILFDNMIAPLAPYAVRGAIWYQGEGNETAPHHYARLLQDLIADWRRAWGLPALAFHLVQLPNFRAPLAHQPASAWARLREAQASALALPHTGMAVTIDLGEAGDIHPKDKIPVGERLAQSALAVTYARDLVPSGPLAVAFTVAGDAIRIDFSNTADGLVTLDGAAPAPFFLAGADRIFHPAVARIENDSVLATSAAVPGPVAVRYAWADNPEGCNLANSEKLPAGPFRSDRW